MAQPSSKQPVEPLSMEPQKGPPTSSSCSLWVDDGSSLDGSSLIGVLARSSLLCAVSFYLQIVESYTT
jgi:hypothetical protein